MKIFEVVYGAPGRSSSMALFEKGARKGNGNSEKIKMTMGAAKSSSNLNDREKLYLALRQFEVSEPPPPGLSVNEAFIKELFALHVKSVDAIRDLQKKLEESNLMLALERIKCQEKEKRIQELNNNVAQLETDLQQEQDAHERTRVSYQQYLQLQKQNLKHENPSQQKKQQNSRNSQTLRSNASTVSNDSGKSTESSSKKTRGTASATKPRTYRRHRNSRGPPLLSPAITPETPFRNSKSGKVLERAIDKEPAGNYNDEDEELPSDVEADSVKTSSFPIKIGVEANSSTNLYSSYLNNKAPSTGTAVLNALKKNYSYDPKVIGDISNEIHKTILNETLENENAKERARRTRRTNTVNSGRRSRSTSSEGKMKTRIRRKSRGKAEKSPKATAQTHKECLFDSGNTKQLLQRLDKLCQNRTVKNTNEAMENGPDSFTPDTNSTMTSLAKQTVTSNPQNNNCLTDNSSNHSKSRGRRKKNDSEDKCNEVVVTTPKPCPLTPVRTITTRNSVARNLASIATPATPLSKSNVVSSVKTPQTAASAISNTVLPPKPSPEIASPVFSAKAMVSATNLLKQSAVVKKIVFPEQPIVKSLAPNPTTSNLPSIASAVAAVSKINVPVSSTSAAIPKANSPGTSVSAHLTKVVAAPVSNEAFVPKILLSNGPKNTSLILKPLLTVFKSKELIKEENTDSKDKNLQSSLSKTHLTPFSPAANISHTEIANTGLPPKNITSNSTLKVSGEPENLKTISTSTSTSSYIEKISHGYTRNMNPLLKHVATTRAVSSPPSEYVTASTMHVTAEINIHSTRKTIYNGHIPEDKNGKCERKRIKYDVSAPPPPHYTNVIPNPRENCMTTLTPYFVMDAPPLVSRKKEKRLIAPKTEKVVEVPSWRIKEFTPLESDHPDLEDTDDSVILKRHQKPEVDEKRRKRWDSQRMREETYLERLKRRMAEREKHPSHQAKKSRPTRGTSISDIVEESDDEMESFQPCIEDIRYIRVEDDIPIGTFGYAMPILHKGIFDLPWNPMTISTSTINSSSPNKSLLFPPTNLLPRRNGAITLNGYGSSGSVSIITPPTTPTLPNSISTCSQAGPSVSSSKESKDVSVTTGSSGASTRQSSKRL